MAVPGRTSAAPGGPAEEFSASDKHSEMQGFRSVRVIKRSLRKTPPEASIFTGVGIITFPIQAGNSHHRTGGRSHELLSFESHLLTKAPKLLLNRAESTSPCVR